MARPAWTWRPATQDVTRQRTFTAHGQNQPGGDSPGNKAPPDARRRPQAETMAITQSQLSRMLNPAW